MSQLLTDFEFDHDKALAKLRRLRRDLKIVRQYKSIDAVRESVQGFVDFLEHALKTHFREEEEALFPYLKKYMGENFGPVDQMLLEHKEIEQAHMIMGEELASKSPDLDRFLVASETVLDVLEFHIDKEDDILWPFARNRLTPEELAEVDKRGGR